MVANGKTEANTKFDQLENKFGMGGDDIHGLS